MKRLRTLLLVIAAVLALGACGSKPLEPYSVDTPPLALVPASQAGVQDKRGRLRETTAPCWRRTHAMFPITGPARKR
jgi:hypothetical protein